MNTSTTGQEALQRARGGMSCINDAIVMNEFAARGIPLAEIDPRENVLTFWAWKALGRSVRKGEHGVQILTWIPVTRVNAAGEREPDGVRPKNATVFHISQTDAR